jgi:type II secretory pathway pseudopilin PulG
MSTGPIAGGVIGGIALIAFISFLVWFCLRKQRQDKAIAIATAQNQQQQQKQADATAAIANQNRIRVPKMGATPKPAVAYLQPPSPRKGVFPEKPADGNQSAYVENTRLGSRSLPPFYPQSPQSRSSIPSPSQSN